ncbi:hypothetical protein C8J56DRAFT_905041 [Mycena floridula]|nr:hypothetical protein C8J56DRAFT_905041 [Mycena floridula]
MVTNADLSAGKLFGAGSEVPYSGLADTISSFVINFLETSLFSITKFFPALIALFLITSTVSTYSEPEFHARWDIEIAERDPSSGYPMGIVWKLEIPMTLKDVIL